MHSSNKHSIITLSDIIEGNDGICDIKYKDMSLPVGLVLELEKPKPSETDMYTEVFEDSFTNEELFNYLLLNEKRKYKKSKTRKSKPIKIRLSIKNKI